MPIAQVLCRELLNVVPDHVALVDCKGIVVEVNAAWLRYSAANGGCSSATGVGSNYFRVCDHAALHGVTEARRVAEMLHHVLAGEAEIGDVPYPCHSPQELRWYAVRVSPVTFRGHRFAALVHTNVTMRTLLRERVQRLSGDITEARRAGMAHEWASLIAHDIKNPLSAILLRAQMLERLLGLQPAADGRPLESCVVIKKTARRIIELIDDAQDAVSFDAGAEELIDAPALLADVAAIAGRVLGGGAQIHVEKQGPGLIFRGHPVSVGAALLCLLGQVSAGSGGRIAIRAERDGRRVILRIDGYVSPARKSELYDESWLAGKLLSRERGVLEYRHGAEDNGLVVSFPAAELEQSGAA